MNEEIKIDDHAVPEQITSLVRQGTWKPPSEMKVWFSLIERENVFQPTFYDLQRLNGKSIWASDAGNDCIGVLEEGITPGIVDPLHVIIFGDLGPDRFLALDLRTSATNPAVCAFIPRDEAESCWIQIAPSLDEFLLTLGIGKCPSPALSDINDPASTLQADMKHLMTSSPGIRYDQK